MKRTLLLAVLASSLLAGTAQAEQVFTEDSFDYCQKLAQLTTIYAKERATGITLEVIHERIREANLEDNVTWDLRAISEYVFDYPHQTPSQEGNGIYDICRNGF